MLKVIGVIPARWASSRFPGKSLANILGKPLIIRVVERARKVNKLTDLVVATDDERIRRVVESVNCKAIMTSPEHPSGTDRVAEAVELLGNEMNAVVNIQGDEPLLNPGLIDTLIDAIVTNKKVDMVTAAEPIFTKKNIEDSSVVKVVCNSQAEALYFSRLPIPYIEEKNNLPIDEQTHFRHIGIYLYRTAFLKHFVNTAPCMLEKLEKLEQLRALYLNARIKVIKTTGATPAVDTPEDIKKVESAIKKLSCEE